MSADTLSDPSKVTKVKSEHEKVIIISIAIIINNFCWQYYEHLRLGI